VSLIDNEKTIILNSQRSAEGLAFCHPLDAVPLSDLNFKGFQSKRERQFVLQSFINFAAFSDLNRCSYFAMAYEVVQWMMRTNNLRFFKLYEKGINDGPFKWIGEPLNPKTIDIFAQHVARYYKKDLIFISWLSSNSVEERALFFCVTWIVPWPTQESRNCLTFSSQVTTTSEWT